MRLLVSVLAASAFTAAAHAAPNLLVNGSFENGLAGWTTTVASASGGTTNGYVGPMPQATPGVTPYGQVVRADNAVTLSSDAAGNTAIYFVDDNAVETLSQTINLVAGTRYAVGFDYYQVATGNPIPFTLSASFGGTPLLTAVSSANLPSDTWLNASQQFTPLTTGAYTFRLTFGSGAGAAGDALVDRAFVQNVPEPGTLALIGVGLAGLAILSRRRARG